MNESEVSSQAVDFVSSWRVINNVHIVQRAWDSESGIYFDGPRESMVVDALGATALRGIISGCSDLPSLADWCQAHGSVYDTRSLLTTLSDFVFHLEELEVVVRVA